MNPLQPQFKIRVFNGKHPQPDNLRKSLASISKTGVTMSANKDYMDIERCVAYPVTYEEEASLLNTLKFTIDKYADILLYYFYIGQSIILYGGYYTEDGKGMKLVFTGTVTRVRTSFADNGRITVSIECMNYGFTKLGKNAQNFTYPDKRSSRKFAQNSSLTVEDLVKGIAKENGVEVGQISLTSDARNVKFTKDSIRYQKNMTDWKFLAILAEDMGCSVWMSFENGIEKLNFASHSKARQSEISFLFPLYGVIKDIQDSEWQKFDSAKYNRPRILRDVSVDEDISQATAVTRSAMYFDKSTGEYVDVMAKITTDKDGKNSTTFYELDESKVEHIHQSNPELADKIRNEGPTSLPWGTPDNPKCASYYYKVITIHDETTGVFDKAFYGITITAKCNQDLDIISQRFYKVRGILSYHSTDLSTSFYLRGVKHVWSNDGTWTELDFIR